MFVARVRATIVRNTQSEEPITENTEPTIERKSQTKPTFDKSREIQQAEPVSTKLHVSTFFLRFSLALPLTLPTTPRKNYSKRVCELRVKKNRTFRGMTTFSRFTCDDFFKYNNVNLDPLTATYATNFYLQYITTWPDYLAKACAPCGTMCGYGNVVCVHGRLFSCFLADRCCAARASCIIVWCSDRESGRRWQRMARSRYGGHRCPRVQKDWLRDQTDASARARL